MNRAQKFLQPLVLAEQEKTKHLHYNLGAEDYIRKGRTEGWEAAFLALTLLQGDELPFVSLQAVPTLPWVEGKGPDGRAKWTAEDWIIDDRNEATHLQTIANFGGKATNVVVSYWAGNGQVALAKRAAEVKTYCRAMEQKLLLELTLPREKP